MSEEEMKALVEMKDMLKYENEKLKQQLQSYKQKEDKLRGMIIHDDYGQLDVYDILQILNEGDK